MNKSDRTIAIVASFLFLAVLVAGFWLTGSPFAIQHTKLDNSRMSDFSNLQTYIQDYFDASSTLPATLNDLSSYAQTYAKDPSTGTLYDYKVTASTTYQLCATFFEDSSKEQGTDQYYAYGQQKDHSKGYDCLTYAVRVIAPPDSTPVGPNE